MNTAETEKDTELYDKIETHFENQLERTNFWLSFAEAKNGAIIAINVALIAVLITIFDKLFFSILYTGFDFIYSKHKK